MNSGRKLQAIPTWKLKHPKEQLDALAQDEGMWSRGYGMDPIAPGERRFPSWAKCRQSGVLLSQLYERRLPTYIGVDLAGKTRPGNAIVALGLDPGTYRKYLLEVRYGNWSSPETAGVLAEVCAHHNTQWIQVENNAYQQAIIDWVKQEKGTFEYWARVEAFTTGAGKADPMYGLPGLEVQFKNEGVVVPWSEYEHHPTTCACDWCRIDREFRDYPKAKTADGVMAFWFAADAITKWQPRRTGAKVRGSLKYR